MATTYYYALRVVFFPMLHLYVCMRRECYCKSIWIANMAHGKFTTCVHLLVLATCRQFYCSGLVDWCVDELGFSLPDVPVLLKTFYCFSEYSINTCS